MTKIDKNKIANTSIENIEDVSELLILTIHEIEKISKFHINSAKKTLDSTSDAMKNINNTNNLNDYVELLNELTSLSVDDNLNYIKELYETIYNANMIIGKSIEDNLKKTQKNFSESNQSFNSLNYFESFKLDPLKVYIDNVSKTFETVQNITSQITEITNNNLKKFTKFNNK